MSFAFGANWVKKNAKTFPSFAHPLKWTNLDGRPSRSLPPQISQKSNHEDAVWSDATDQPSACPSIEEE